MNSPIPRKHWDIYPKISPEIDLDLNTNIADPVLRQLLYNRGIVDCDLAEQYLHAEGSLHDPFLLGGMERAIERLYQAIAEKEAIVVYGDYDVDGVTATALLTQLLLGYGARVRPYIPDRFEEGYGVNKEALAALIAEGTQVVITVDCGIRSPAEAEYARQMGLDLIISDHHEPHENLPDALALVCPRLPGDGYPEKNLAGVGVAYKIAEALLKRKPLKDVSAGDWLDLVAVGTVSDVVPLVGENRSLVRAGLRCLRRGRNRGLVALANISGLNPQALNARDIGFMLGPRLNAAGRLDSALNALKLLMSTDMHEIGMLAQELDNQNRKRQNVTQKMQEHAEGIINDKGLDNLLFIADETFSIDMETMELQPDRLMGVVGLAASRLVDRFYRPAVVGYRGETFTRASCRSIPEFHITGALDECADLLERYGGHALAAGLTVRNDKLEALQERLGQIAQRKLAELELRPVLKADMEITLRDLRPALLEKIDSLEPTGQENAEAAFVTRNLEVRRCTPVGSDRKHLRLVLTDGVITYDAIAFRQGQWADQLPDRIDILYRFERNFYRDRVTLQLNIRDLKPSNFTEDN